MTEIPNSWFGSLEFRIWILFVICILVLVILSIMAATALRYPVLFIWYYRVIVSLGTGHFSTGFNTCPGGNKRFQFLFHHTMVVAGLD